MLVVSVRRMRVLVRSGIMTMKVAVLAHDKRHVHVIVMLIVVAMTMLVLERPVSVPVPVRFREVEEDGNCEESACSERPQVAAPIAHDPCRACSDEGSDREDRAGAGRADSTLSQQIELQAESVARGAAREQSKHPTQRGKVLTEHERQKHAEACAERALPPNDLRRIQIGEGSRERAVERPGKSGEEHSGCPPSETARAQCTATGDQQRSSGDHQPKGDRHARPDRLAEEYPRENDGEDRLEVQEERRARRADVLEAPRETDGGDDRTYRGDED